MPNYWSALARRGTPRRAIGTGSAMALGASLLAACGSGKGQTTGGAPGPKDTSGLLSGPVDTTGQARRGGILKRNGTGDGSLDPNLSVGGISTLHEIAN